MDAGTTFDEVQPVRQLWLWALVLLCSGLAWASFVVQIILGRPFGNNPAPDWLVWVILVLFGIFLPVVLAWLRLITTVDGRGIVVRFWPFTSRTIPFDTLERYEVRTYRPLLDYGGWGIRWSPTRGWAYDISGNRGVHLGLSGGKRILIGSQRPEELVKAIEARQHKGGR